ncbi:DUF397 domain-containing protein [Streptomyces sp. NPDC048290]|uniref:DUF397 domain-containing protein n=1 Tax=Streptomyces sp. NPDC048290 TaxID=3155811 RepID=UPI0034375C51
MTPAPNWRKSSYSGGNDGDNCVEVATGPTHTAIRDTKARARATLTVPSTAFAAFLDALKRHP